jgi:dihydrofolate reductase
MRISLIAAVSDNAVIGRGNALPWHLPADLRRFKRLTMGHWVLMGRKTFDSIRRPLPGRITLVLTRRQGFAPPGVLVAHTLPQALALAEDGGAAEGELFVAGGAAVYRETLGIADRLLLTRVHGDVPGDTFFPEFDPGEWRLVEEERQEADGEPPLPYTFLVYQRQAAPAP